MSLAHDPPQRNRWSGRELPSCPLLPKVRGTCEWPERVPRSSSSSEGTLGSLLQCFGSGLVLRDLADCHEVHPSYIL
jgi:hypothetical protein